MLSTMIEQQVDANHHSKIAALGQRVLAGGHIGRDEALWLINLESSSDVHDLLAWANRIREKFKEVWIC